MRILFSVSKLLSAIVFLLFINGCGNAPDVPFPKDEDFFPQPISKPIHFGESKQINWSDSVDHVVPVVKKFDFNKLPVKAFDSAGFWPFKKKPQELPFDIDKLPDTAFDYDKLPSKTFRFETSILPPPILIKSAHPYIKTGITDLIYDFGEQQGLFGTNVSCAVEDKEGFIWISTDQGLYRYDGENLYEYLHGNSANDIVFDVKEDAKGQIWLSNLNNGFMVLDLKHSLIKRLSKSSGFVNGSTVNILPDDDGRMWITSFNSMYIVDEANHTIKTVDERSGMRSRSMVGIAKDKDDNIWVSTTQAGVNIINVKKGRTKHLGAANGLFSDSLIDLCLENNKVVLTNGYGQISIVDILQKKITNYSEEQSLKKILTVVPKYDRQGRLWLATGFMTNPGIGLEIIDFAKGAVKIMNTESGIAGVHVNNISEDKYGQLWVATTRGLNILNRGGNNIQHAGKREITTLADNERGQVWIGMTNSDLGVYILDTTTGMVKSLTTAQGLCNDTLQNIMAENGNLWIGSNGGVDFIDSTRKSILHIDKRNGFAGNNESNMMKDSHGNIWFGSNFFEAGVDVFNPVTKKLRHFWVSHGVKDTTVSDLREDADGKTWLCTNTGGAFIYDLEKNSYKYFDGVDGLKDHFNKVLLADSKGNMWIGTGRGIYIVNPNRDSALSFSTREGLSGTKINSLHEYAGKIYVSNNGGLDIITPPDSSSGKWRIVSFGKAQGVNKVFNSYSSDVMMKNGVFLWGDKGITTITYNSEQKQNGNTNITGIDIFNEPQHFNNSNIPIANGDTVWSNKKDTFYLKELPSNAIASSTDKKITWDSVADAYGMPTNLDLPYYQNYLQFHFAQQHLGSQDTVWYKYILQGIDKKWSNKTYNPFSQNYLNLPSGSYVFKVASYQNGNWGEPASFSFAISPPWWRTWWAYLLYLIFLFSAVWTLALYRSRKLKRENLLLEQKIALRTTQLEQSIVELKSTQAQLVQSEKMASLGELTAGIAHEIQNPLNFVNNFSEVNKEMLEELKAERLKPNADKELEDEIINDIILNEEKINHHGKRADAIVKGMLQHSRKSEATKEPTDINALADEYLRLAYHGIRAKDNSFNATLKTDFDASIGKINIVPQDMGRVLLNLYNNAFYAVNAPQPPEGGVGKSLRKNNPSVSVSTRFISSPLGGRWVEIKVTDNGGGIPSSIKDKIFQPFFTTKPTGQGTGLGLSLSYDIVKAHGGEIKVESKEGEGTTFIIQIPI